MDAAVTRVLVAVADKPLRDSLTEMIKGSTLPGGGKLTCEICATSEEALRVADVSAPDVALISINLEPLDGFETLQRMIAGVPGLGAALVALNPAPDDFRRALRAGARDLIEVPVTREALMSAIAAAADVSRGKKGALEEIAARAAGKKREAAKIVVFSTKGGTGKTFVATNLGAGLAAAGKRVAIVDLDLQFGDVAIAMGLIPQRTLYDLVQTYSEIDLSLLDEFMLKHPSGLHVLPAPLYPDQAEKVTLEDVKAILEVVQGGYDFVIVDTPPFFEDRILYTLDWADHIFLITSLDLPSVKNIKTTFSALGLTAYPKDKLRVVVNRADSKVGLDVAAVQKHLGRLVEGAISSSVEVPRALNAGETLIVSKPNSKVSQELQELVHSIPGSNGHVGEKRRSGLFRRIAAKD